MRLFSRNDFWQTIDQRRTLQDLDNEDTKEIFDDTRQLQDSMDSDW